jgi:prepilin-type N-terminal cleavage/methylation domain-containing protein
VRVRASNAGLTLIELLLVMGLLAVLLGAGLGSLASLNPGERAAVGLLQDALRSAHNSAVSRMASARVRIDPKTHTLVTEGLQVVGTWHFEDSRLSGAEGLGGVFIGMDGDVFEHGWIGNAIDFGESPRGAEVEFAIQDDPIFDVSHGFAIDLHVRPHSLASARLLEIPDVLEVDLTGSGGVKMRLYRKATESTTGFERRGAGLTLESEGGVLREDRWVHLSLTYDRRQARILADGMLVASTSGDFELWRIENSLRLGGRSAPPPCVVDELAIAVVVASEVIELPGDVSLDKDTPRLVQFAPGGALDPTVHMEPVEIGLEFPSGKTDRVRVGMYGTVE